MEEVELELDVMVVVGACMDTVDRGEGTSSIAQRREAGRREAAAAEVRRVQEEAAAESA